MRLTAEQQQRREQMLAAHREQQQLDLVVIDWASALPRRPGQPVRVRHQPVATTRSKRLWQPTAIENRPRPNDWANAAIAYQVKLMLIKFLIIIAIGSAIYGLAFLVGFWQGFQGSHIDTAPTRRTNTMEKEPCASKYGPCGLQRTTTASTSAPTRSLPSTQSQPSTY